MAARQTGDILDVVCKSAASLLKTPTAIIVSVDDGKWSVDATYGIKSPEKFSRELKETTARGETIIPTSLSINNVSPGSRIIPETITLEGYQSILAETLIVGTVKHGVLLVMDKDLRMWTDNDRSSTKYPGWSGINCH